MTSKKPTTSHESRNLGNSHEVRSDRKSNLVIFGLKELPKGTRRHERLSSDLEEATNLLSSIDSSINDYTLFVTVFVLGNMMKVIFALGLS